MGNMKARTEYWFKPEFKRELLYKGTYMYRCAEEIGVNRPFLTNIANRKAPVKLKSTAYAITKYINPIYEIADVFDIKEV